MMADFLLYVVIAVGTIVFVYVVVRAASVAYFRTKREYFRAWFRDHMRKGD